MECRRRSGASPSRKELASSVVLLIFTALTLAFAHVSTAAQNAVGALPATVGSSNPSARTSSSRRRPHSPAETRQRSQPEQLTPACNRVGDHASTRAAPARLLRRYLQSRHSLRRKAEPRSRPQTARRRAATSGIRSLPCAQPAGRERDKGDPY